MSRTTTIAGAALVALLPLTALTVPAASADETTAPDARRAVAYKVIAKINRTEVVAGEDTVRITGRVKPKAAGAVVLLQQRADGSKRWKGSGKAKVKRTGTFVLKDKPSTSGVRYYRVVKAGDKAMKKGISRELKLAVWGWEALVHRAEGSTAGVVVDTSPQFGTETFRDSLSQATPGTSGHVEYTLGKKCRTLRATYALTDDSASGATGSVAVGVDGVTRAVHGLATGTIVADHVLDVTGAFRIRFDLASSATPAGTSAVGTPEVLCLD